MLTNNAIEGVTAGFVKILDIEGVAEVLHEAAETHHIVWRITDGDDPER